MSVFLLSAGHLRCLWTPLTPLMARALSMFALICQGHLRGHGVYGWTVDTIFFLSLALDVVWRRCPDGCDSVVTLTWLPSWGHEDLLQGRMQDFRKGVSNLLGLYKKGVCPALGPVLKNLHRWPKRGGGRRGRSRILEKGKPVDCVAVVRGWSPSPARGLKDRGV